MAPLIFRTMLRCMEVGARMRVSVRMELGDPVRCFVVFLPRHISSGEDGKIERVQRSQQSLRHDGPPGAVDVAAGEVQGTLGAS